MALRPFSLLLRRKNLTPHFFFNVLKRFSTQPNPNFTDSKPSNLSDRLSFVFDQIDVIERERTQKDDTLQRIRAWRESKTLNKTTHVDDSKTLGPKSKESGDFASKIEKKTTHDEDSEKLGLQSKENGGFASKVQNKTTRDEDSENLGLGSGQNGEFGMKKCEVELVHPWPEWIELMERLVNQNYFDHKRKDEDKMVEDFGFDMSEVVEEGFDFTRDWKTVQTACLNFGRDRFDILRALSRSDIQILVGYGCPTADKKVVFSAKLLRKHVHLDEGDVCSSCSLRGSCERAYLLTNKEDEARTIDIMRLLLTYGFDPVNGSVDNKSLLKQKSVKTVVRKLLHQIVKLSAVPIDPNLPQPVFKKPPPKVKQPPPPPRKRVGRDDVEMKKGDWLCPKCDFMNFAKNTVCLQCDAKRPKRQLLPGEWECPECNFLNYRRNTECFHCECRRPPDEFTESQMQERQQRGPRTRFEKVASGAEISSAWNFDFDDNESDGADIAAFECADTPRMGGDDFPVGFGSQGVSNIGGSDDDFHEPSHKRVTQNYEGDFSAPNISNRPGRGFDDFDDEEDEDDIESYEIDTRNNQNLKRSSDQGFSEPEDFDGPGRNRVPRRTSTSPSYSGPDFNSDDDLPVHPNWKSSHAANSRSRGSSSRSRNLSFGSDEDISSDLGSRKNKKERFGSNKREIKNRRAFDSDDGSYGSESSDDDQRSIRNNRSRGNNKAGPTRGGNSFKGRGGYNFAGDSSDDDRHSPRNQPFRGSNRGGGNSFKGRDGSDFSGDSSYRANRNSSNDNFERSSRGGFRGGFKGGDFGGQKRNDTDDGYGDRERGSRKNDRLFDRPKRGGFGDKQRGRGGNERENSKPRREERFGNMKQGRFRENDGDQNFGDERPRRVRIIER